jgi:hypothetical protein
MDEWRGQARTWRTTGWFLKTRDKKGIFRLHRLTGRL